MKIKGEKNKNRKKSGKNFDEEELQKVSGGNYVAMRYGGTSPQDPIPPIPKERSPLSVKLVKDENGNCIWTSS